MSAPSLILASSSPRRAAYLRELGFTFRRVVPDVDEKVRRGESPRRYVRRVAEAKAGVVSERYPEHWLLGAGAQPLNFGRLGEVRRRICSCLGEL